MYLAKDTNIYQNTCYLSCKRQTVCLLEEGVQATPFSAQHHHTDEEPPYYQCLWKKRVEHFKLSCFALGKSTIIHVWYEASDIS